MVQKKTIMANRKKIWKKLEGTVSALLVRTSVVLLVDCNLVLQGTSNQNLLADSGLDITAELEHRMQALMTGIELDQQRDRVLLKNELTRATYLGEQLKQLSATEQETGSSATIRPAEADVKIACSVCGVYFASESGVDQHTHQRHPEVEPSAQIDFDRARHSVSGGSDLSLLYTSQYKLAGTLKAYNARTAPGPQGSCSSRAHGITTSGAHTSQVQL